MRPGDVDLGTEIDNQLTAFENGVRALPGIAKSTIRRVFIEQLLESIHRVEYVSLIRSRSISDKRTDPNSELFDPIKAAILHSRSGNMDEAFWVIFLSVHFGRHQQAGWRYLRDVYGRLAKGDRWDWSATSSNPDAFRSWLADNLDQIRRAGVPGGFGNHRKYLSLNPYSANGTGAAVESYISWVHPPRSHVELINHIVKNSRGDRKVAFDELYESMATVASFGRTARFDYLTMIGNLSFAEIEPGSAYLVGSTGPLEGARLLFGGARQVSFAASSLDRWLIELDLYLRVGMQVLEDSLCNWQKSPGLLKRFRG